MYQPQNQRKHSQNIRYAQAFLCVCVQRARLQSSAMCMYMWLGWRIPYVNGQYITQKRQQNTSCKPRISIECLELWLFGEMFMLAMPRFKWILKARENRTRRRKQRNKFLFASLCTLFCVWFHSLLRHIGVKCERLAVQSAKQYHHQHHRIEILTVKSFLRGAIKMKPFYRNTFRQNDQHSVHQTFSFPFSMDAIDVCDEK